MPTYVYRCSSCGHEFEQFQKMSEDPLTICPACGGEIHRVIHPVGVVFKGSGWYITDSRKKDKDAERKDGAAKGKDKRAKEPAKAGTDGKAETSSKSEKPAKAAAD